MKKVLFLSALLLLLLSLAACGQSDGNAETTAQAESIVEASPTAEPTAAPVEAEEVTTVDAEPETASSDTHVLVAYFTYSENMGDTSGMTADAITSASMDGQPTDNTDGNLHVMALEAAEFTGGDLFSIVITDPYDPSYRAMVGVAQEDQNSGKSFTFVEEIEDFEKYDVIYLGVPVWWGKLPQPLVSFFEEYDFSGKTIIPFGIHLGSRFGNMLSQIAELAPGADVRDGYTVSANTANDAVREEFAAFLRGVE